MIESFTDYENSIINKYTRFNHGIPQSFNDEEIIFLNDGYVNLDDNELPLAVTEFNPGTKYAAWQYQALLYKKVLDVIHVDFNTPVNSLLDVSCGIGGGLSFYRDFYNIKNLFGIDLNPLHIALCRKKVADVSFINASATNLPLQDNSISIITSVEACSYYDPFDSFIKETFRVLEPGGSLIIASPWLLALADYFPNFIKHGFVMSGWQNINKNVRTALAINKYAIQKIDRNNIIVPRMIADEQRYLHEGASYFIVSFKKPEGKK